MSLTMFLAFAILGCDFLLYALFQWIYGGWRALWRLAGGPPLT